MDDIDDGSRLTGIDRGIKRVLAEITGMTPLERATYWAVEAEINHDGLDTVHQGNTENWVIETKLAMEMAGMWAAIAGIDSGQRPGRTTIGRLYQDADTIIVPLED